MSDGTPFPPARPTTYKGIRMRSRLEAIFAASLESVMQEEPERFAPPVWEYEPMCFASQRGQYLPDFAYWIRQHDGTAARVYIEVKPVIRSQEMLDDILERMSIIWDSEPDAILSLCELGGKRRAWEGVRAESLPHGWWTQFRGAA